MASNELEVLDPAAATVEKLTTITGGRALNRRNLMAGLGIAGAAIGAKLLSDRAPRSARRQRVVEAGNFCQNDYLNFLLNIKYLTATFYSAITQGTDLPSPYTVNGTSYYPTLGSGVVVNIYGKVAFTGANSAQITDMLNEIYYDELNSLIALQTAIGPVGTSATARPALDLKGLGNNGTAPTGNNTTATTTSSLALAIARLLEDVSVTAYTGLSSYLTGSNLTLANQIMAVDGAHAGAIRLAIILQNVAAPGTVVDLLGDSLIAQSPPAAAVAQADDTQPGDPGTATGLVAGSTAAAALAAKGPQPAAQPVFGATNLVLTSVAAASGGVTAYTGTITDGAANAYVGETFTVAGFDLAANNGTFVCTASSATVLTLKNTAGVADTHAATAQLVGTPTFGANAVLLFAANAASAAGTTTYIGSVPATVSGAAPLGQTFTVAGFTSAANNGTFVCSGSTLYSITLNNPAGVAESHTLAGGTVSNLTASAAAVAAGTTVYTGTIANAGVQGGGFAVAGFDNAANNGIFVATASAATTLTLSNAGGVADTHAATATPLAIAGWAAPESVQSSCSTPTGNQTTGSNLTCTAPQYQGFFSTGAANGATPAPAGFAFKRTTSQVLSILYGKDPNYPIFNATLPLPTQVSNGGFYPGVGGIGGNINEI